MPRVKIDWLVIVVAAGLAIAAPHAQSGHALFEQALAKERVEGNLQDAIRMYERVVATFASDRALAAKALVQIGLCYEKLGRDEARRAYERLIRDFADQSEAVAQARTRLTALTRPDAATAAQAVGPSLHRLASADPWANLVQSLSPDGTKAVFNSYSKGLNLGVYDYATGQARLLTDFDWSTTRAYLGVWSPDARRIAYVQAGWRADSVHEIRAVTLDGESLVIFRNEANPGKLVVPFAWVPDGTALLMGLVRADGTSSIGLVPARGGPFSPLRSHSSGKEAEGFAWPSPPSMSPDARFIAAAEGVPGARDIYTISVDGRTTHRLTDHPADDYWPVWSPDGRHLAFLSNRYGGVALWVVSIKDGQPAGNPMRIKDGMHGAELVGWTGRGLAYQHHLYTSDIYTMPVGPASGVPAGSPQPLPFPRTGRNVAPVWSPDGKYLAFISGSVAEPDRRSIVLLPEGGGAPRELLIPAMQSYNQPDGSAGDLRWFGDGRGLGFSGTDAKGEAALARVSLATGEWQIWPLPVKSPLLTTIEWNGDGTRYFYARQRFYEGDVSAIVERDLQTDRERVIYSRREVGTIDAFRGLRFSPDRRLLAFNDNDQGVGVLDIETGAARILLDERRPGELTEDAAFVGPPAWSADGQLVLTTRQEKETTELLLIPVDGGAIRRLPLPAELRRLVSSRSEGRQSVGGFVYSPDGRKLAFMLTTATADTWLLENPLAEARAERPRK